MESKNIIRKYFSELCEILITLPDILDSITMKFYAKEFISPSTKSVIMSSGLSVPQKANLLLTFMEIRVDQYRECFPLICSILKEEAIFVEVATKMRYDYATNEDTSDSPALIHDDHNSTACDIDETADNLEMVFDSLKKQMKRMAKNHSQDVNFSWLKEHVQLCFQYACTTLDGEMSSCLIYREIQDSTTLESLMEVMLETHIFGYLNFEVLYTFISFFQTEKALHKKFEQYKKCFILFIQNNFKSIIDSASHLLEMSPDLDLPELEVELDKSHWESKSLLQWNETMKSIVEWSENLMIKGIEPRNDKIVIKYYFLPYKLLRIANELENKAIVKKFNSVSAKFSPLLARLLEIRDLQLRQIASEIELDHAQQDCVDDLDQSTAPKEIMRFRETTLKKTIQKRLTVLNNAISTLNERKISRTDQIALKAEKNIRESLNIHTDIWFPKDMPAKDMVKKLTSYSRKMNKVLQHDDMQTLSRPFHMKGMLFTDHENDLLTRRFPLLKTKTLIAPQHDADQNCTIIKSQLKTFHSKQDEEMFFKYLLTANASMANDYQTNRIMHTSTKYLSTVKVSPMLSCSYIIDAENDFKISTDAKRNINNLDNVVKKHLAQRVNRKKVLKECKDFLNRYGSHICIGPIQVGAIYWVKCYTNKQTSLAEKIKAFHRYVVEADRSFIPVLAINGSNVMNISKIEFRHDAADITSKDSQNTFIEIQSGGKDVPIGNEEWILGHLGNYYDTRILDHGKYVPVWDIITSYCRENLTCPEELVLALKESHFQLSIFYKFLEHIRFEHYHDKKLTCQVAITNCIKGRLQNPHKTEDLPLTMLQKIMHYNCSMFEVPNNGGIEVDNCEDYFEGDFEYPFSQLIHPVSIFLSIFLCANHLLRQEMLCRLSTCQLAVPLIFRDPFTKKLIFPLWALRSIIKKIKTGNQANSQDEKELEIVEYEMPIISFLRIANLKKTSKSKIMNHVIDSDNMVRFFHRDSSGGSLKRQIGNGMIDMSWYIPGGRDNFSNAITFLNLHGNAAHKNNQNQVKFLRECSSMCFVLVEDEFTEEDKELITSLSTQSQCHTIVMFLDGLKGNFRMKNVQVETCESTNAVLIENKFQSVINEKLKKLKRITERKIASFHVSAVNNGIDIDIDENSNELQIGLKEADEVITEIAEVSEESDDFKTKLVPLQGKQLWHDWVEKDKEQQHMVNKGSYTTITNYNKQLEMEKIEIMHQRKKYKLHTTIRKVVSVLENTTCDENFAQLTLPIFLQNIRLGLNNVSRKNLVDHYKEYFEIRSQYHAEMQKQQHESNTTHQSIELIKETLGEKYKTITKFSFGLEHILREVAHVYEVDALENTDKRQFSFLAKAAATMLIQAGHALELMDGDSAYIQIKWIKAVLNECKESLGAKSKVYIISVLGVQSAGKSTLLNTMFGVQFNVGAGRCTRGAYMQLLPVHEELKKKLCCDYIIIVDTEGLLAPEMSESQQHDRELSAFVIGIADLTLIKLNGEIAGEMEDILHTTVHAFIRMHIAKLRPSCKFIFQGMADRNVSLGEDKLVQRLDEITLWAAKGEKHSGDILRFTQVINFNPECDIHYHGGLWNGNPPMAPVNIEYSESAESLKIKIFDRISEKKHSCLTIAEFSTRLDILWKALLSEDFVFNFKNAMEINAYKELERTYSDYEWDLQHKLYQWYETTLNVLDCNITTDDTTGTIELLLDSTKEKLNSIHTETLKDANEKLEKYFKDSSSAQIIVKWKETFLYKISKFAESLRDKIEDKCSQHINNILSRREIKRELGPVFKRQVLLLVDSVANDTKTRQADLSKDKLLELFECHAWKKIKGMVRPARKGASDVESEVEIELSRYFTAEKQQFVRMKILDLSGKKCTSLTFVIVEGDHIIMKDKEISSISGHMTTLFKHYTNPGHPKHIEQKLEQAQKIADDIFQSARNYLDSKKGEIYKPSYVLEMLKEMEMTRDGIMETETEFDLTEEYWLEACVIACKYAMENHFNKMIERFNQENDPFYYLENEVKPPLLSQFLSKYYQYTTERKTAKSFCIIIINNIRTQIKRCLGHKIVDKMKSEGEQWPFDKRALKTKIMVDMAESIDFQNYVVYLTSAKQSFQFWTKRYLQEYCDSHNMIQAVVFNEISSMKDFIIIKLNELEQNFASKSATVEAKAFLKAFCEDINVIKKLGKINDSFWGDAGEIDVKHFSKCLKEELEATETNAKKFFEELTFEQMIKWENRPDQFIQDRLGCCEQCPFCGEICDLANEHGAEVKHSVKQHRPQCLNGYRWIATKKVVTDVCTFLICGDKTFQNGKTKREYHPYKEYETIYPNWYIQADPSINSSAYWKWFIANNMSSIAEHYSALPNEVPESWKELDWSIVKEDLLSSSSE